MNYISIALEFYTNACFQNAGERRCKEGDVWEDIFFKFAEISTRDYNFLDTRDYL